MSEVLGNLEPDEVLKSTRLEIMELFADIGIESGVLPNGTVEFKFSHGEADFTVSAHKNTATDKKGRFDWTPYKASFLVRNQALKQGPMTLHNLGVSTTAGFFKEEVAQSISKIIGRDLNMGMTKEDFPDRRIEEAIE